MIEIDMAPPGAERLVGTNPLVEETVARDIAFGEGPVWDKRNKQFFFTDICGDAVWKWKPGVGQELVLKPSAHANGMCFDLDGRLLVAGWGGRTVWRFGPWRRADWQRSAGTRFAYPGSNGQNAAGRKGLRRASRVV